MRYQEIQVTFINAWGSLMYTAQLYHAVHQEKLLPESKMWKDMELVISLQGSDKFFVGEPPKEPEEYLKRFMLSMGYSAALFANNRRKKAHAVSAKGPRQLMKLCAVGQLFAGRYCKNDAAVAWTKETMKPIIEAKLDDDSDDDEGEKVGLPCEISSLCTGLVGITTARPLILIVLRNMQLLIRVSYQKSKKVKQSPSGALLRKPRRSGSSIPTTDFLLDLANALHAEIIESNVDYLRLHRFCWMLLRSVNEACKPRLLETYGGGYLGMSSVTSGTPCSLQKDTDSELMNRARRSTTVRCRLYLHVRIRDFTNRRIADPKKGRSGSEQPALDDCCAGYWRDDG